MTTETMAIIIAGLVIPFVVALIRRYLGVEALWAVLLTLVVAVGAALAGLWATGNMTADWRMNAAEIFVVATVVYRLIENKLKEITGSA